MTAKKAADHAPARPTTATTAATTTEEQSGRKPWKKKSPVEVMLAQIDRLRGDVEKKEEELKQAKRQMQKLEEARRVLEST